MRILLSNMYPPAAAHPATGGNAPTSEPGIIAKALSFFKGVYIPLYQINVNIPIRKVKKFVVVSRTTEPANNKKNVRNNTFIGSILPDGMGLFFVRSIKASVSLSW